MKRTEPKNSRSLYKSLIFKTLGITLLAFFLSVCLQAPFTASTSTIFSSPEKNDFTITDLYAQIADRRPVRKLEDRIAVVDIGIGGREEIAEVMEILALCSPKAIGLDVMFDEPTDDDSRLISSLQNFNNLVLPIGLEADGTGFKIVDRPFLAKEVPDARYGVINLPTSSAKSSVREYSIEFPTDEGVMPSFVAALADIVDPIAVKEAQARGNGEETIAYHSKEYQIYSAADLADHAEELTDRIVLVGSLSDASDMHATPVNSYMPGLMIYAHALSTMLDREWFVNVPRYYDYFLAFTICFLIVLATVGIKWGTRGMIIRLIQAVLAYLAVRIGYSLFVDHNLVCNFSTTLLMIAFGLFAVDIWNGFEAIIIWINKKIKNLKNKNIQFS